MIRAILIFLMHMAQPLHANPVLVVIEESEESEEFTQNLEDFVDAFTYGYLRSVMEHEKSVPGRSFNATATGWEINGILIVEVSKLSRELRDPLLVWLRRIFVDGEAWHGKTFKVHPGHIGVAIDPERPIEELKRVVENFEWDQGHQAFNSVCDYWLTQIH